MSNTFNICLRYCRTTAADCMAGTCWFNWCSSVFSYSTMQTDITDACWNLLLLFLLLLFVTIIILWAAKIDNSVRSGTGAEATMTDTPTLPHVCNSVHSRAGWQGQRHHDCHSQGPQWPAHSIGNGMETMGLNSYSLLLAISSNGKSRQGSRQEERCWTN